MSFCRLSFKLRVSLSFLYLCYYYYYHFSLFFFALSQVVPSRIPWEGELSVDTCVIAANPVKGRKDFLAGRVHKVYEGKNKYAVKYLASKRAVVFKKVVLKREQLQVVYGAWCSK